jgi:cell division ATPase FtsA
MSLRSPGRPKKPLTEEILKEITEKLMEKMLDMVNQNVQDALKKFQDTKNKEHEKTETNE